MNYIDRVASTIGRHVPDCDRELLYIYALLLLVLGDEVDREDVHNAWSAWAALRQPEHPSLIPYDELTQTVQMLDQSYVDAIKAAKRDLIMEAIQRELDQA